MSFVTNTSPYGSNNPKGKSSPSFLSTIGSIASPAYGVSQIPGAKEAIFGKQERNYQQSTLGPEQQGLYQQLLASLQNKGAGGSFGQSADYYRDLLSDDSQTANAMFSPELRRFKEQIIPDLAEQFSGYGGIGSGSFRNAAVGAGTDLSERLGSIRAQLRQQGAQGLSQMGQFGLSNFNENIHRPETHGLIGSFVEGAGKGIGEAAGKFIGGKF